MRWILLFAALTALYFKVFSQSAHSSDSASGFLRALDFAAGNLTLSGWVLPVNHYLTSDVMLSALLSLFLGNHPYIMDLVPAIWWAAVVVTSLLLVSDGLAGRERRIAVGCTGLFLGLPIMWGTSALGVLPESYIHVGTILYTLWGYALVRGYVRGAPRRTLAAYGFLIVFSGLGDPMVYTVGWLPVIVTCGCLYYLGGDRRHRDLAAVTLVGIVAAVVVTKLFALGGLRPQKLHTAFVDYENWGVNLGMFPRFLLKYAGGFCFGLTLGKENLLQLLIHLTRIPLLFVLIYSVLRAGAGLARLIDGRSRGVPPDTLPPFFDTLLAVAILLNSLAVLTSQQVQDTGGIRYLLPAFVYAAILLGRVVTIMPLVLPLIPVSAALSTLFYAQNMVPYLLREPAIAPSSIHWTAGKLADLKLSEGYAEFWEAHILTVLSREEFKARALVGNKEGEIHPYFYQSKFEWFFRDQWKSDRFFVLTCEVPDRASLREADVFKTFGPPLESHDVQEFRLHIYPANHPRRAEFETEAREALAKH